jgi:hypothetical protein
LVEPSRSPKYNGLKLTFDSWVSSNTCYAPPATMVTKPAWLLSMPDVAILLIAAVLWVGVFYGRAPAHRTRPWQSPGCERTPPGRTPAAAPWRRRTHENDTNQLSFPRARCPQRQRPPPCLVGAAWRRARDPASRNMASARVRDASAVISTMFPGTSCSSRGARDGLPRVRKFHLGASA